MRTIRPAIRTVTFGALLAVGSVSRSDEPAGDAVAGVRLSGKHDALQAPVYTATEDVELMVRQNLDHAVGQSLLAYFADDGGAGATLEPAEPSLRAQLGLPADQGLIVATVTPNGPVARAGLAANDVLLTLGDTPLANPDDLTKSLKSAGEKPVRLRLIRAGKPMTIEVRPFYRVMLGPVPKEQHRYYIGIPVTPPDDALRAHLDLPPGQGLVVSRVVDNSPAARAGLKPFDILLEFGDTPLTDSRSLVDQIQATGGKAVAVKILRGGKPLSLTVTPELRAEAAEANVSFTPTTPGFLTVHPHLGRFFVKENEPRNGSGFATGFRFNPETGVATAAPVEKRLDVLLGEVRALQRAVEALQTSLKEKRGD